MAASGQVQPAPGPWQAAQDWLPLMERLSSKKINFPSSSWGVSAEALTPMTEIKNKTLKAMDSFFIMISSSFSYAAIPIREFFSVVYLSSVVEILCYMA